MAAYSKDEFYTASDFSDLSDEEAEVCLQELADEIDNDDGDKVYCICQQPATTEMIACDNDLCEMEWFHYECVGLSSETIPDMWICDRCRPDKSPRELDTDESAPAAPCANPTASTCTDGDESQPSTSNDSCKGKKRVKGQPNKTSSTDGTKEQKKKRKIVERISSSFQEKDAKIKANSYLQEALNDICRHPVYSASYPIALCIIAIVNQLLVHVDTLHFNDFALFLTTNIWLVATAGISEKLAPDASEKMWYAFEKFRCDEDHVNKWLEFLCSLGIQENAKPSRILFNQILHFILEFIVKDLESNSLNKPSKAKENQQISCEEEQVLRYVAGYIPFALFKKFQTHKNKVAEVYCKLLSSWKVSSCNNVKTFLDYTNEWIRLQNRGGLYIIDDDLYLFFRTIENECRTLLTKANLDKYPGLNIKNMLFDKVMAQKRVHTYWCSLTESKVQGSNSKSLLDLIVTYYIKIRCKAFIKVYLDLKKSSAKKTAAEKKVSKKAEKALRKDLASKSSST